VRGEENFQRKEGGGEGRGSESLKEEEIEKFPKEKGEGPLLQYEEFTRSQKKKGWGGGESGLERKSSAISKGGREKKEEKEKKRGRRVVSVVNRGRGGVMLK